MSHTNVKIYLSSPYGVSIADIQAVTECDRNDIGGLITTAHINKWAKWKPVRSTELDLDTEEERRMAGRTTPVDYSRQYGVYAPGAGNITSLSSIHNCTFEYERPEAGQGYYFRFMDFVHPEYGNLYGYRSDAHTDLEGVVYPLTGRIIVPNNEIGMELEIDYSPLTTAEAHEMISIKDFLTNESGETTTIDPLTCYPCALITQGGYHYIRGLYKQGASAISTIGSTGSQIWCLDATDPPAWNTGEAATMSLFLCSQEIILHDSPNLDIADWITIDAEADDNNPGAWEAWFSPIPDATGKSVFIGSAPVASDVQLVSAAYSANRSSLVVTWSATGSVTSSAYTISAALGEDTATKSILLRPGTTGGTTSFTLATDFPSTLFIAGTTSTYQVNVNNTSTTPATVVDSEQYTLTY